MTPQEIASRLSPLDRDGMVVMLNPPKTFPAFLVLRLCKSGRLVGAPRPYGKNKIGLRPPLVTNRGEIFVLNHLGKKVADILSANQQ